MTPSAAASRIVLTVVILVLAALAIPTAAAAVPATQMERQRELFRDVFESVERGNWATVDALSALDRQIA